MLDGLQMNVPPAMNKRWQGMITIGICELGGEGTGGVSHDSGITMGKVNITNGEYHQFPFTESRLITLPCLNVADVRQYATALNGALHLLCLLIIHRQPNSSQRSSHNIPFSRESDIN